MSSCVCFGGGADIAPLYITDHDEALGPAVVDRPLVCDHTRDPELLIHGNLRLDSGDQVAYSVRDLFVELKDRLCRDHILFLAVFGNRAFCGLFRFLQNKTGNEGEIGIEAYYDRSILFHDALD